MSKPKNIWQVVACPDCHDEVIRFFKRDGRVKYAYSSQVTFIHKGDESGDIQRAEHDQVWFAFDLEDDLGSGPEWIDLQCRCRAEAGTTTTVELGRAYDVACSTAGRAVLLGEITD